MVLFGIGYKVLMNVVKFSGGTMAAAALAMTFRVLLVLVFFMEVRVVGSSNGVV